MCPPSLLTPCVTHTDGKPPRFACLRRQSETADSALTRLPHQPNHPLPPPASTGQPGPGTRLAGDMARTRLDGHARAACWRCGTRAGRPSTASDADTPGRWCAGRTEWLEGEVARCEVDEEGPRLAPTAMAESPSRARAATRTSSESERMRAGTARDMGPRGAEDTRASTKWGTQGQEAQEQAASMSALEGSQGQEAD